MELFVSPLPNPASLLQPKSCRNPLGLSEVISKTTKPRFWNKSLIGDNHTIKVDISQNLPIPSTSKTGDQSLHQYRPFEGYSSNIKFVASCDTIIIRSQIIDVETWKSKNAEIGFRRKGLLQRGGDNADFVAKYNVIYKVFRPKNHMSESHTAAIENAPENDDTMDPQLKFPPEVFEQILQYLSAQTLGQVRMVSTSWKNAAEHEWRTKCFVTIDGECYWLKNYATNDLNFPFGRFLKLCIENPTKCFQKFKLYKFDFVYNPTPEKHLPRLFNRKCCRKITHLELTECNILNTAEFYFVFFKRLQNLEKLVLRRPVKSTRDCWLVEGFYLCCRDFYPQQFYPPYPPKKNLTHLIIDLWGENGADVKTEIFPILSQHLLGTTPNLEKLEMFYSGATQGYTISLGSMLHSMRNLYQNSQLQRLKHIHIYYMSSVNEMENFTEFMRTLQHLWRSNLPLETLQIEINTPKQDPAALSQYLSFNAVMAFGVTLKTLKLFTKCDFLTPVEFGCWAAMENLKHLSLSYWMAKNLVNARYFKGLKTLEVVSEPEQLMNREELRRINRESVKWIQLKDYKHERWFLSVNRGEGLVYDDGNSDNEEFVFVLDEAAPGPGRNAEGEEQPREFHGFLFDGYRCLLNNPFLFLSLTHFRMEHSVSYKVFRKLPMWMPNLIVLEARIPAGAFPEICEQWSGLKKLTLLRHREKAVEHEDYEPINDMDLVGCTEDSATTIKNLKELEYFKIERPLKENFDMQIILGDTSYLEGFSTLPKLKYLEIVANMTTETVMEMFRHVPECIVYQPSKNLEPEESHHSEYEYFYGMRNFVPY